MAVFQHFERYLELKKQPGSGELTFSFVPTDRQTDRQTDRWTMMTDKHNRSLHPLRMRVGNETFMKMSDHNDADECYI